MKKIKKPKWDKLKNQKLVTGFYDETKRKPIPPCEYISKGMDAYANIDEVRVDLKIINVLKKNIFEAEILQICNGSGKIGDLYDGDIVYIEEQFIDHLSQTNGK